MAAHPVTPAAADPTAADPTTAADPVALRRARGPQRRRLRGQAGVRHRRHHLPPARPLGPHRPAAPLAVRRRRQRQPPALLATRTSLAAQGDQEAPRRRPDPPAGPAVIDRLRGGRGRGLGQPRDLRATPWRWPATATSSSTSSAAARACSRIVLELAGVHDEVDAAIAELLARPTPVRPPPATAPTCPRRRTRADLRRRARPRPAAAPAPPAAQEGGRWHAEAPGDAGAAQLPDEAVVEDVHAAEREEDRGDDRGRGVVAEQRDERPRATR